MLVTLDRDLALEVRVLVGRRESDAAPVPDIKSAFPVRPVFEAERRV